MFGGLRKFLEEATAQINPFDGGKTASTVRAARNTTPARTVRQPVQQIRNAKYGVLANNKQAQDNLLKDIQAPRRDVVGDTVRSVQDASSRIVDQYNIWDNNRTFKQRTPTQTKSAFQQTGQFGGQLARGTIGGTARVANTFLAQAPQITATGRMLLADATNNPLAWRNANQAALQADQRFKRGQGGILNAGTLYDAEEAKRGDFRTGLKRIGGGVVESGLEVGSLGVAGVAGKQLVNQGIKQGLKSQLPTIGKNALLNTGQGAAMAYNQDASPKDIAKSALLTGGLGTAADVGLGLAGAGLSKVTTNLAPRVKSQLTPLNEGGFIEIGRTPKHIHPDDQNIMADFIDMQRGAYKPDPKTAYNLELDASRIAERYGLPMPNTAPKLANVFDKRLMQEGYGKPTTKLVSRVKSRITPLNEGGYIQIGKDGRKSVKVTKDQHLFDTKQPKEWPKVARQYLSDNYSGKKLKIGKDGEVTFTAKGNTKYSNPKANIPPDAFEAKMRLTPELDNALSIAKYDRSSPTKPGKHTRYAPGGFDYHTFEFEVGGQKFKGVVNVAKDGTVKKFYDISPVIKKSSAESLGSKTTARFESANDSNASIPNKTKPVNPIRGLKKLNEEGFVRIPGREPKKPKGFIVSETKPRAGRVDTVRVHRDPKTGKMVKTIQSEDAVPSKIKDKELRELETVRKQLIDEETRQILSTQKPQRNLIKEVRDHGGISSSAYETLPSSVKRKTGMSADRVAQEMGFKDEDELVQAINDYAENPNRKMTHGEARELALENLENGNSQFNEDWKLLNEKTSARRLELDRLNADRIKPSKSEVMSEAELKSLEQRAIQESPKTRQGVQTATKGLKEEQVSAVTRGDLEKAKEIRTKIGKVEQGLKRTPPDLSKSAETTVGDIEIKDIKGKANKEVKQRFMDKANTYLGEMRASQYRSVDKARKFSERFKGLSDDQKVEVILATDDPTYKPTSKTVQDAVDALHAEYDDAYRYFTSERGIKMGYQHSYYPRMYKHPSTGELIDGAQFRLLQRGSSRQKGRTAELVNTDYLVTKDPAEAIQRYYTSLENAASGKKFLRDLERDGLVISSTEPVRGMRPIVAEGMQEEGIIFYAKPEVANSLNKLFGTQEASGIFEKLVEKGAGLNSFFQSFVLSGGIPNTPVNAFGFMQVMKSAMAGHPLQAGKAFFKSMGRSQTDQFFKKNSSVIQEAAENGLDIRINYQRQYKNMFDRIKETKRSTLGEAWDQFTNDATFQRFMPMLEIMHYKQIRDGLVKRGADPKVAAKRAADATKNFFGKTDMAKQATRNKVVQDFVGAVAFAPRFRESMINFWGRNAKALNPKNYGKVEYRANQAFMLTAAGVWAAMEGANYALNGNLMHDNPDGKKDKLLIPGKDKDVGIPFLPSIATVPRNAAMGLYNAATGNFEEAGKNISSFASMPLKTLAELFTNENFGQRIYDDKDPGGEKLIKAGSHIVRNNMQPWLREGLNLAGQSLPDDAKKMLGIKKKSGFETVSNALEAPLRFYDPQYYKGGKGDIMKKSKFSKEGTVSITDKTEKNTAGRYTSRDKYDAVINAFYKDKESGSKVNDYDSTELQTAIRDVNKEANDTLKQLGLPKVKADTRVAQVWAKYQKKLNSGEISKIKQQQALKYAVKDIYKTSLSNESRDFYSLTSDNSMRQAIKEGLVTKKQLDEAIALDNMLTQKGLQSYPQIGKKLRSELGYGYVSSGRGRGGGRRSKKGKFDYTVSLAQKYSSSTTGELRKILEKAGAKFDTKV